MTDINFIKMVMWIFVIFMILFALMFIAPFFHEWRKKKRRKKRPGWAASVDLLIIFNSTYSTIIAGDTIMDITMPKRDKFHVIPIARDIDGDITTRYKNPVYKSQNADLLTAVPDPTPGLGCEFDSQSTMGLAVAGLRITSKDKDGNDVPIDSPAINVTIEAGVAASVDVQVDVPPQP